MNFLVCLVCCISQPVCFRFFFNGMSRVGSTTGQEASPNQYCLLLVKSHAKEYLCSFLFVSGMACRE